MKTVILKDGAGNPQGVIRELPGGNERFYDRSGASIATYRRDVNFTYDNPDSEIFDAHVTTDPRLKYIPPVIQKRWTEAASAGAAIKSKSFERKLQVVGAMHRVRVPSGRGRYSVDPAAYVCWILSARRTCAARASGFDANGIARNSDNQSRAFLRNEKRHGNH